MSPIEVSSPARIAVTLLDLNGEMGRVDGTIGFAIDSPRVVVRVSGHHQALPAVPDEQVPALLEGISLASKFGVDAREAVVELVQTIPPHVGLGHKTQTALAVALGLLRYFDREVSLAQIARESGRGGTSGVGSYTFQHGGIVVDAGHRFGPDGKTSFLPSSAARAAGLPPLIGRFTPSDELSLVLIRPLGIQGASGDAERAFFSRNCPVSRESADRVIADCYMRLLPGLLEGDVAQVSDSINAMQEGDFKSAVWDSYDERLGRLRRLALGGGLPNLGMSSLGPSLFSVIRSGTLASARAILMKASHAADLPVVITNSLFAAQGARIKVLGDSGL